MNGFNNNKKNHSMALFLLLGSCKCIRWSKFGTERKLKMACSICEKVIRVLNQNNSKLTILPDSECSSSKGSKNDYCDLIAELPSILETTKTNPEQSIPLNACSEVAPCLRSYINPPKCEECNTIVKMIVEVSERKRLSFLQEFCSSSSVIYFQICNSMFSSNSSQFIERLQTSSNVEDICERFCSTKQQPPHHHQNKRKHENL